MSVTPCIVIPIYNHKDAIGSTLASLMPHSLHVFVVDDGSDGPTAAVLAELARIHARQLTLLRLPVNGGKGAAVMAGLRAARQAGYTHALQIDADGQHDASDVPRFLDQAREKPHAVIIGRPVYDSSVPKSRLYGRYLTHIWVWIETLSLTIRDSMCGFRLYPLEATCALIDRVRLPTRMEFDIEVLVRLHWRGAEFVSIPTRVIYATDGVSHFDVIRDNVLISKSHTRLVAGMALRLPMLLARKLTPRRNMQTASERHDNAPWWRVAERGSRLGMMLLALGCRTLGPRLTSLWLHPIVAYFLVTGRAARVASHAYFSRLQDHSSATPMLATPPQPGWRSAYRHMLAFAQSGLDKLDAWSGRIDLRHLRMDDTQALDALIASGRGALIIGSHLGNIEMARALAVRGAHTKVTAIVYTEHARQFNSVLASAHKDFAEHLVQVSDFGPQTALMMQARIARGELLVIVGDRTPAQESGRTTSAEFLGAPARFAQGPYVLAHVLGCPVYLFFCIRDGRTYRLHFESFADRIELPRLARSEIIAKWAQRYASRLEHYCVRAPYQWFNFFDFWA